MRIFIVAASINAVINATTQPPQPSEDTKSKPLHPARHPLPTLGQLWWSSATEMKKYITYGWFIWTIPIQLQFLSLSGIYSVTTKSFSCSKLQFFTIPKASPTIIRDKDPSCGKYIISAFKIGVSRHCHMSLDDVFVSYDAQLSEINITFMIVAKRCWRRTWKNGWFHIFPELYLPDLSLRPPQGDMLTFPSAHRSSLNFLFVLHIMCYKHSFWISEICTCNNFQVRSFF